WLLVGLLIVISFLMHMLWYATKRYLSFKQRKHETVFSFARLHPYEQLAVVWLLNAAQDQRDFIQQSFNQSGLLKYIIDARLSWGQRSEEHTSELQSRENLVCRLLLEKKNK